MGSRIWHKHWPKGMPTSIDYPVIPVGAIIKGSAERFGDKVALYYHDQPFTYRQLYEGALRFARALRSKGLGKGNVVAIHMFNNPQYAMAYYGILLSGATFSPVNPLLPPHDLIYQLNDCGAKAVVTHERVARSIREVEGQTGLRHVFITGDSELSSPPRFVEVSGYGPHWYSFAQQLADQTPEPMEVHISPKEQLAHIAYTGGTTGRSKGVMLTHYNVVVNTLQTACWGSGCLPVVKDRGLYLEPVDPSLIGEDKEYPPVGEGIGINLTPWFHAMGVIGSLNATFLIGNTTILHTRFDPEKYLEDAERYRVTGMGGAPPIFVGMIRHPDFWRRDLSSVRRITSGAAPLAKELFEQLQKRFPNAVIGEGYGMTEMTMVGISNPGAKSSLRKLGSVGIPIFDTDCKIIALEGGEEPLPPGSIGEICIRGPQIMLGYHNNPEETAATLKDGWLHTGDIGMMDNDGYVYIVDRKKDMLLYKGYNVYPRELEEILFRHPAVANAAVIGKPDPEAGEIPKAYVVLKPYHQVAAEELMAFVNKQVVPYRRLREVAFIDDIPVSAAGKVLKRVLREMEAR